MEPTKTEGCFELFYPKDPVGPGREAIMAIKPDFGFPANSLLEILSSTAKMVFVNLEDA
jgi:hypothetical protein